MNQMAFRIPCILSILAIFLNANVIGNSLSPWSANQIVSRPVTALQNAVHVSPFQNEGPARRKPNSISPYKIKEQIDQQQQDEHISLEEYWKRLGIETERWGKYGKCEVEVFELELDREEGPEVILRLYDDSGWSMGGTRYLVFKPGTDDHGTEWKLLGHIDLEDQRYSIPEHRVISSGESRWLVLRALTGRGSGYGLYLDQWYEFTDGGIRIVLKYPSKKILARTKPLPILEAESKIISAITESGTTKVAVEFSASYVLFDNGQADQKTNLWNKKQKSVFIQKAESEEFKFVPKESELSEEELNTVYNGEGPSNSEILRYNYRDLEKIALGKDETIHEWLRLYLKECKDTQEKENLLKVLAP